MSTLLFWFSQGETKEHQQYKNNMINGNKFNLVFLIQEPSHEPNPTRPKYTWNKFDSYKPAKPYLEHYNPT